MTIRSSSKGGRAFGLFSRPLAEGSGHEMSYPFTINKFSLELGGNHVRNKRE